MDSLRLRLLATLTTVSLTLGACSREPGTSAPGPNSANGTAAPALVPSPIGPFTDTSPSGMLACLQSDFTTNSGYRTWKNNGVHWIKTLSTYGETYESATLVASIAAGNTEPPVGASSVLELYADSAGKTLNGWAVLAKGTVWSGKGSWFSFELTAGPDGQFGEPTVNDMGDPDCAQCHAPAPGYIIPM